MDSGKFPLLPQGHLFHSLNNVFVGLRHSDLGLQGLDFEAYTLWREALPHWVWVLGWRRMRGGGTRQLGEGAKLLKSPFKWSVLPTPVFCLISALMGSHIQFIWRIAASWGVCFPATMPHVKRRQPCLPQAGMPSPKP